MSESYVLTLPLKPEIWQKDILDRRFEIARKIYNACLGKLVKEFSKLKKDKEYITFLSEEKSKERNQKLNGLTKKYILSEYGLHSYVKHMNRHFKRNIDSNTAQKLATRAFKAFEKYRFGNAKKVFFKRFGEFCSVEGKANSSGIRFKENCLLWLGMKFPVTIRNNDIYAQKSLCDKVKYCRILKKTLRGDNRFFIQLVLEGIPPQKRTINNSNSGVGLDIGTQTIAISSEKEVKLLELAPDINKNEAAKKGLQRKLDRQRRSLNPHKYNKNGTIIKNNDKWIFGKNYIKTKNTLSNIQRKIADKRKQSHEKLANFIISLGTDIKVEKMEFRGLQKRAGKTTVNEKTGRFNRKKRFGKSLANKAPTMLLEIIDRKLNYQGKELKKIDTFKVKASQFNHFDGSYTKKPLSERWNIFYDFKIQRDLYSAFLIMNTDETLETIDTDNCKKIFDNFKKLHDKEITRLKNSKPNIASMGI